LEAKQVYALAALCLVLGLAIGYLFHGPQEQPPAARHIAPSASSSPSMGAVTGGHMPSLAAMKRMADQQAAPLLEKLGKDPNNTATLVQVGAIYHTSHQFKQAAVYYDKAVQIDPKNVANRTKLASSLYRDGDVDGALAQLNTALTYDPKDANCLFDLGMIKLQGKQDGKGALAAWQKLLKTNPQLSPDRKAVVQKLMAEVLTTVANQRSNQGARSK
jgi:cytochrome c-type biogenesis protein CcmH/NrfG